jgi:[acyl-carrier-protein] S-malonyltransferase
VIAVQAAADAAPSAMVSVIGLDSDKVAALCDAANEEVSEDERVQIANFLCPVSWLIYLFFCFSFTSGVVIGIIQIYIKVCLWSFSMKSTAL